MGEKLYELAENKFGTLTPADKRFFKLITEGQPADFSTWVSKRDDSAKDEERVLAADRVM